MTPDRLSPLSPAQRVQPAQRADRLRALRGSKLGLLDNGKPYADTFLRTIGRLLKRHHAVAAVELVSKPNAWQAATGEELERLRGCQGVVTGFAD